MNLLACFMSYYSFHIIHNHSPPVAIGCHIKNKSFSIIIPYKTGAYLKTGVYLKKIGVYLKKTGVYLKRTGVYLKKTGVYLQQPTIIERSTENFQ